VVKFSAILTVYNREYELLLSTLRSLSRCDTSDLEVVIVNDRSTMDYSGVQSYLDLRFPHKKWIDLEDYEAFRLPTGHNNPAYAFNKALEAADGESVFVMSSDVIATPRCVHAAKRAPLGEAVWTPLVIDIESGQQYCGPIRLFPAPWFLAARKQDIVDVGGWDEAYLRGMCYEDNDFIGRLMLKVGRFLGDWSVACFHQSHAQPWYDMNDPVQLEAHERNKSYTREKWGGIPFSGDFAAFDVTRRPYRTGDVVHECKAENGKLEKAIEWTQGIFAPAREAKP